MEELLAHPGDAVPDPSRWAIVGGLALFLLSIAFSAWRLKGKVTWERVVVAGLLGLAAIVFEDLSGGWLALVVVSLVGAALTVESVRHRPELAALRAKSGEKRQAGSSAS
jgi:hypothetical protein